MNTALLQLFEPIMKNNRLFTKSDSNQTVEFKELMIKKLKNKDAPHHLIVQKHELDGHFKDELMVLLADLLHEDSFMALFIEENAVELLHELQAVIDGKSSMDSELVDKLVDLLAKVNGGLDDKTQTLFQSLKELAEELKANYSYELHYPIVDLTIKHNEIVQLDPRLSDNVMQLITQIEQVFNQLHEGERMENVARQLLPLLQQWDHINKQLPNDKLSRLVGEQLNAEDFKILQKLQKLYEDRAHFQSKNMYGNNATVSRSDVAQWLNAILNEPTEPINRVIPLLNNEQMFAPRMSILHQQAIYNSSMESVQRVEAEITQRIVTQIQQNMLLQANASQQSLSIRLAPEHLGTLNIQFTQVNGEMIVRIMTNSLATKEVLEANLQQLKHAFSPHQVQIVRDDTEIDEEMMMQEEEQLAEENEEDHEEHSDNNNREELITIDFTSLIEELLVEEVEADD